MDLTLQEIFALFTALGIPEDWILIIALVLLLSAVGAINLIVRFTVWFWEIIKTTISKLQYDQTTKDFINIRKRVSRTIYVELVRQNTASDWNDFYFTELDAQVEVKSHLGHIYAEKAQIFGVLRRISQLFPMLFGISAKGSKVQNLFSAIKTSSSRAFLIIGDPGSGKTVSLRHLAMRMAEESALSNRKTSIVPLYLNLKSLDIPYENISADNIRNWVIEQVAKGQDRIVDRFFETHFDAMLLGGEFFFIFDSFDEIPAILDAKEDSDAIKEYSRALSRFIDSPHGCKGLVASRPFRAPKAFVGQKMEIQSLNKAKTKSALQRYLIEDSSLANRMWQEIIVYREDLLNLIENPFYLSLLAGYILENKQLPKGQYDLFENFILTRLEVDQARLKGLGYTDHQVFQFSSELAYVMLDTPHIGLEARVDDLFRAVIENEDSKLSIKKINLHQLLSALNYSKIGAITSVGEDNYFGFVHRRFHEYLTANYVQLNQHEIPLESIFLDNRWRETLILLCEVLPIEQLEEITIIAELKISIGMRTIPQSHFHDEAIESMRFLKDAFRSRIAEVPQELKLIIGRFIKRQFKVGNLLDKKRGTECLSLADEFSASEILVEALNQESDWLRETAIRGSIFLRNPSTTMLAALRKALFLEYGNQQTISKFGFTNSLLSLQPSLKSTNRYHRILTIGWITQPILFFAFVWILQTNNLVYEFVDTIPFQLTLLFIIGVSITFALLMSSMSKTHIGAKRVKRKGLTPELLFYNPWILFWFFSSLFSFVGRESGIGDLSTVRLCLFGLFCNLLLLLPVFDYSDFSISALRSIVHRAFNAFRFRRTWLLIAFSFLGLLGISFSFVGIVELLFFSLSLGHFINKFAFPVSYFLWFFGWTLLSIFGIVIILFALTAAAILILLPPLILIQFVFFLKDEVGFVRLAINVSNRPKSAREAAAYLSNLKSGIVKYQYANSLGEWLDIADDWSILISAANRETGQTRDKLFQLAELWQDLAST
ncbi:MAG: NACHT domain-containing protein [Chloroflexi bacterium]|nr:MAG: NACHT domain-containing protein [Chloroflexota bacterium]MBL1196904.1 NACHT domain-containing protein [Chloroflexota bacterium]NOH14200.1 NACHT domain-containing protein [Chloroflexota bacterium]